SPGIAVLTPPGGLPFAPPAVPPKLLRSDVVAVLSLMRRRGDAPFPERPGHLAAAAPTRVARRSAQRSLTSCRARVCPACVSISEVKVGSWKLLHHAIVSTGAALTVLASSCFGTGCNASSVQLVGVSAFGETKLGPTVQPCRETPNSRAVSVGRTRMRMLFTM